MRSYCHLLIIMIFLLDRQECGVRDERRRELEFLEKVW